MSSNKQEIISLRACGYKVNGCRLRRLGALQLAVKRYGIRKVNQRLMKLGRFHPVMLDDINEIYPEPDDTNQCSLSKFGYSLKATEYRRWVAIVKAIEHYGSRIVAERLVMLGKYHPIMIDDLEEVCILGEF
jgi:hypothetical protein